MVFLSVFVHSGGVSRGRVWDSRCWWEVTCDMWQIKHDFLLLIFLVLVPLSAHIQRFIVSFMGDFSKKCSEGPRKLSVLALRCEVFFCIWKLWTLSKTCGEALPCKKMLLKNHLTYNTLSYFFIAQNMLLWSLKVKKKNHTQKLIAGFKIYRAKVFWETLLSGILLSVYLLDFKKLTFLKKLDAVGPVDNWPSPD